MTHSFLAAGAQLPAGAAPTQHRLLRPTLGNLVAQTTAATSPP